MNTDPIDTDKARRHLLWSIPGLVVHLGVVALVAVGVVVLRWRGDANPLRTVSSVLSGVAALGFAAVLVAVAFVGLRHPNRRLLALALSAVFLSALCSFLSSLSVLVSVARPLRVANWVFTAVALPLALLAAWRTLRRAPRSD